MLRVRTKIGLGRLEKELFGSLQGLSWILKFGSPGTIGPMLFIDQGVLSKLLRSAGSLWSRQCSRGRTLANNAVRITLSDCCEVIVFGYNEVFAARLLVRLARG